MRVAASRNSAIGVGETLDSVRCRGYVSEFRQRLARHRSSEQARDFVAQLRTSRLWTTAGRRSVGAPVAPTATGPDRIDPLRCLGGRAG